MTNKEKNQIVKLARYQDGYLKIIAERVGKSPSTVEIILSDRHGRKKREKDYHPDTIAKIWEETRKLAMEQAKGISAAWFPDEKHN